MEIRHTRTVGSCRVLGPDGEDVGSGDHVSYLKAEIENVLLVRWQTVTPSDVAAISAWIERVAARSDRPTAYAAVIPTDSPPPDGEARTALLNGHHDIADHCATLRLVILGSGMRQALVRSVSAGFLLATGLKGKGFDIDDDFTKAVDAVADKTGQPVARILNAARDAGIILDRELPPSAVPARGA